MELGTGADYSRIEYAYHLMARTAGIAMEPCRLLEENDRAHFMTRRFDRDGSRKHHVQSRCAMQHLDYNQRGTHADEHLFPVAQQLKLRAAPHTPIYPHLALHSNTPHSAHPQKVSER